MTTRPPVMPKSATRFQAAPEFFSPHVREARRFYLDLAPSARQPLVVVCGGFEYSAPDYSIDRAGFPYFSIEFVARGCIGSSSSNVAPHPEPSLSALRCPPISMAAVALL